MKKLLVLECVGKQGNHIRIWATANLGRTGDITSKQWFNLHSFAHNKGLKLDSVITVGLDYNRVFSGVDFANRPATLGNEHHLTFSKFEIKGKYFAELV